jgi:hypothetical protein
VLKMNRLAQETSPYLLQHAQGGAGAADQKRPGAEASLAMPSGGHAGFAGVSVRFAARPLEAC